MFGTHGRYNSYLHNTSLFVVANVRIFAGMGNVACEFCLPETEQAIGCLIKFPIICLWMSRNFANVVLERCRIIF